MLESEVHIRCRKLAWKSGAWIVELTLWMLLAGTAPAAAEEGPWEQFPGGSAGRVTAFTGAGGVVIPAFIRKPAGPGPFPVVISLHGGGPSIENTYRYGRSTSGLVQSFIAAGWTVYSIDFRPNGTGRAAPMDPIEYEDTVAAIETARRLPFVDPQRVGLTGSSHGGHVMNRMASRVNARCAVLYSPTWIDTGQMNRALEQEKEPAVLERLKLLMSFVEQLNSTASRQAFDRASALEEASQVRFPLFIVDGGQDTSLQQWMVREYVARLRAAGKVVETYLPADGEHGFHGNDTWEGQEARKRTLDFFKKYLAR